MTFAELLDKGRDLLDSAEAALSGEPARAIGYGAALVIVGVVALANSLGFTRFGSNLDLPTALGLAGVATTTLVTVIEGIRRSVYSPKTVAEVAADNFEAGLQANT